MPRRLPAVATIGSVPRETERSASRRPSGGANHPRPGCGFPAARGRTTDGWSGVGSHPDLVEGPRSPGPGFFVSAPAPDAGAANHAGALPCPLDPLGNLGRHALTGTPAIPVLARAPRPGLGTCTAVAGRTRRPKRDDGPPFRQPDRSPARCQKPRREGRAWMGMGPRDGDKRGAGVAAAAACLRGPEEVRRQRRWSRGARCEPRADRGGPATRWSAHLARDQASGIELPRTIGGRVSRGTSERVRCWTHLAAPRTRLFPSWGGFTVALRGPPREHPRQAALRLGPHPPARCWSTVGCEHRRAGGSVRPPRPSSTP